MRRKVGQLYTPRQGEYLWPHRDPDPRDTDVFVRPGDDLRDRRWVRLGETSTFTQCGSMVDFYTDRTPPVPWHLIGCCYLDYNHTVLPAVPKGDGWLVGGVALTSASLPVPRRRKL